MEASCELTKVGTIEFRKGEKTGNVNQNQPWPHVFIAFRPISPQIHAGRAVLAIVPSLVPVTVHVCTQGSLKCLLLNDQLKPRTCISKKKDKDKPLGQTEQWFPLFSINGPHLAACRWRHWDSSSELRWVPSPGSFSSFLCPHPVTPPLCTITFSLYLWVCLCFVYFLHAFCFVGSDGACLTPPDLLH